MEKTLNFKKEEKYIESLFKAKKFIKKFKILVWGPSLGFFLSYTISLGYLLFNEAITLQTLLFNIGFIELFFILLTLVLDIPNILLELQENKLSYIAARPVYSQFNVLIDKIEKQKTTSGWATKTIKTINRWVSEIY